MLSARTPIPPFSRSRLPACAASVDIFKCFDQVNRPLIYELAALAGLPQGILSPYRTFLETSQAHFQFGKYIGLPH